MFVVIGEQTLRLIPGIGNIPKYFLLKNTRLLPIDETVGINTGYPEHEYRGYDENYVKRGETRQ